MTMGSNFDPRSFSLCLGSIRIAFLCFMMYLILNNFPSVVCVFSLRDFFDEHIEIPHYVVTISNVNEITKQTITCGHITAYLQSFIQKFTGLLGTLALELYVERKKKNLSYNSNNDILQEACRSCIADLIGTSLSRLLSFLVSLINVQLNIVISDILLYLTIF